MMDATLYDTDLASLDEDSLRYLLDNTLVWEIPAMLLGKAQSAYPIPPIKLDQAVAALLRVEDAPAPVRTAAALLRACNDSFVRRDVQAELEAMSKGQLRDVAAVLIDEFRKYADEAGLTEARATRLRDAGDSACPDPHVYYVLAVALKPDIDMSPPNEREK